MNGGNDGATIKVDINLPAKCAAIKNDIQTLSSILAQLPSVPANTVTIPTIQQGPLNFHVNAVDSKGVAVFNLNGNTVLNNGQVNQIEIIIGSSVNNILQLVVINLYGTDICFNYGNFVGSWLTSVSTGRAQTIWNFPEATSLNLSRNWMGALLAPYAAVTASSNTIDGATAVKSLTICAELHNPPIRIPACL
jgi:choice-of-anchor A domain-containing protein